VEVAYGTLSVPPKAGTTYSDTPIKPRGERPSFDAAGGDAPPQGYLLPNQMVQHPPLYYLVEAGVLRVPGVSDLAYDRQVALLRWSSLLMLAPLPLLIWATGRRLLGPDSRAPALASVIPVTMPGLSRLGGSVNNDNLLILLTAVMALVLAGVLRGDLRRRTGALVGLLLGLALFTKGLALVLPPFVVAVYGVAWLRHRRSTLVPLALAAVVSAAVGGWWWARNLVLYGAVQPQGLGPVWLRRVEGPARSGFTWEEFVPKFFVRLSSRFWGGLGYPDAPVLPAEVTGAWLVIVVAVALVGVAVGIGGRGGRLAAATQLLPAVGLLVLIFYGAGDSYVFNGRLPGIQGRYIYAGLAPLAVLFALGLTRIAGRAARVLPLLVLGAGLLTQAWAWRLLIAAWWVPRDTVGNSEEMVRGAFSGIFRWSPWPEWMTALPFGAVPLFSIAALAAAAVVAVRRGPRPDPAGDRSLPTDRTPQPVGALEAGHAPTAPAPHTAPEPADEAAH
jgi:4-amino-4-deoxy-L-arabinose transferase-like glycosyltransferase